MKPGTGNSIGARWLPPPSTPSLKADPCWLPCDELRLLGMTSPWTKTHMHTPSLLFLSYVYQKAGNAWSEPELAYSDELHRLITGPGLLPQACCCRSFYNPLFFCYLSCPLRRANIAHVLRCTTHLTHGHTCPQNKPRFSPAPVLSFPSLPVHRQPNPDAPGSFAPPLASFSRFRQPTQKRERQSKEKRAPIGSRAAVSALLPLSLRTIPLPVLLRTTDVLSP